jgi:probable DNA metabolism protein
MKLMDKVKILANPAKYDASCASSGSNRPNIPGGLGNAAASPVGICHSWAADGRCISLLKILFSNLGEAVAQNIANPTVLRIRRTSDQVNHEIERLHGFVRFRQLAGELYYAAIEPDHNVVRLLVPHFIARFADQQWLIHDLKRGTGIYYDGVVCRFLPKVNIYSEAVTASRPLTASGVPTSFDTKESTYQSIWNQYFQAIAIPERTNPRAQRQRMPRRYWKHLVERVAIPCLLCYCLQ